jgi:ribosome recycling factor
MSKYKYLHGDKIIEKLVKVLASVRTGRVNSSVLDHVLIHVPAWGGDFKIIELATINITDVSTLMITPFDKSTLSAIEKAILASNLGVNPVNDGAGLRLVFPAMTEENRKAKVKELGQYEEESKIEVRTSRQGLLKTEKAKKEAGEIGEDELKRFENDLQKEVETVNKEIEQMIKQKSEEIMKI